MPEPLHHDPLEPAPRVSAVLKSPDIPSILVETGFLTNRSDAKLLRSDKYLDTLASSMAVGLSRYRDAGRPIALETLK